MSRRATRITLSGFTLIFYTTSLSNSLTALKDDIVTRTMPIYKPAFRPTTSRYASSEGYQMRMLRVLSIVSALSLFGCATALPPGVLPIDQVPMYGGTDRSAYPDLKAADETFIQGVTKEFGSRETASQNFVNYAFELYRKDDLPRAMRRFNQAWLLNPNNPEVYWGFASVLHDRGDYCQSTAMMDKALELGIPAGKGFLADAGLGTSRCALTNQTLSPAEQKRLFERSEQLFRRGEQEDPNQAYVYGTWARAYRDQRKYPEAWQMIAKQRSVGGKPSEQFLSLLSSEFPEPIGK